MNYYLGVDIGTTSAKAVAFSTQGEVLLSCSHSYPMHHPAAGFTEQDPDEICRAVYTSMNNVCEKLAAEPLLVSFSAAMHALILMSEDDKPLTRCIIWADNRAAAIADDLKKSSEAAFLYQTTGVPLHAMSPLCKIIWFREIEPAIFYRTKKFIGIKEYLFFQLFGEYVTDTSIASATGLLNLESLVWDDRILQFAGIRENQLPAINTVKAVFLLKANTALHPQISSAVPFVIGGSDGAMANLATGADESALTISIGTSSAARIVVRKPEVDEAMRTFCYHVKDDCYIVGGPSNNGAVILTWLKDNLLQTSESFAALFEKAKGVAAGSEGLLFIPYILGERAPVWDAAARGTFVGFSINHTQAHLIRACMESVVYAVYGIAQILFEKHKVTAVYATGGFTQSDLWLQVLADVCNLKVIVSDAVESSALGAVLLGMEAVGKGPFKSGAAIKIYEPDSANREVYEKGFKKFGAVYAALKDTLASEVAPSVQAEPT